MNSKIFFGRIFTSKMYWLSVMAAIVLLLCTPVYTESVSGREYIFLTLFYNDAAKEALEFGEISMYEIICGMDISRLWMFCPIIAGVPSVINRNTERFVMFRSSKDSYVLSKYFVNLVTSSLIPVIANILFALIGMLMAKENFINIMFGKKMLCTFVWGVMCSLPSIFLSEFVRNKYLILCIPFVLNYFLCMFAGRILPNSISPYVQSTTYQMLYMLETKTVIICMIVMTVLVAGCAFLKKFLMERRCDCGQ